LWGNPPLGVALAQSCMRLIFTLLSPFHSIPCLISYEKILIV
jgi:hypothetical protein